MGLVVVYGAYFGDEGKGAVVDRLADYAMAGVRYNGGPNAGHTIKIGDKKIGLHHIPSTIMRTKDSGLISALSRGTVIDPYILSDEANLLEEEFGIELSPEIFWIDPFAHIILPHYKALESLGASDKIGTTKRGIGPTYEAKVKRDGIRFSDIFLPSDQLIDKLKANFSSREPLLATSYGKEQIKELYEADISAINEARKFSKYVRDVPNGIQDIIERGGRVIAEGAQGLLLDIDHGTYPYVTSSNPGPSGALQSLNIHRDKVEKIIAVFKSYSTRVGRGPFVVELKDERGDFIREKGREFGTTTGRPRRCGWIDIPALQYTTRQADELFMTKLDVLAGMPGDEVYLCVGYKIDRDTQRPYGSISSEEFSKAEPILQKFPAWKRTTTKRNGKRVLTKNAELFVTAVEELLDKEIVGVGVGPERDEYIEF